MVQITAGPVTLLFFIKKYRSSITCSTTFVPYHSYLSVLYLLIYRFYTPCSQSQCCPLNTFQFSFFMLLLPFFLHTHSHPYHSYPHHSHPHHSHPYHSHPHSFSSQPITILLNPPYHAHPFFLLLPLIFPFSHLLIGPPFSFLIKKKQNDTLAMQITITVQFQNNRMPLLMDVHETLLTLKEKISKRINTPASDISVYYNNRYLTDDKKTIKELKIENNAVVYLKRRRREVEPGQKSDMTEQMLKNPMVKNMLKNPEVMKGMLESFPGLKKQINKNPELRMIMNNPNAIEEFEKLADNPDYMSQQLKNVDIAMSKLENIPGGFNMMNSMIKDVRDPLTGLIAQNNGVSVCAGNQEVQRKVIPNVWKKKKSENFFVKYRREISEIRKYGFDNINNIASALGKCGGDVDGAIDVLFKNQ